MTIPVLKMLVYLPFNHLMQLLAKEKFFEFSHCGSFNPLPLLFKSLLPGQEDCVFSSGHLNLHATPETGLPSREKIITIKLKKTE
jgi:hypothetical protein